MPIVRVYDAQGTLLSEVEVTTPCTVGRAEGNTIRLSDPGVSRHHGRIEEQDGEIVFVDLGSTRGTYLDGEKVSVVAFPPGTKLELGNIRIEHFAEEGEVTSAKDIKELTPPAVEPPNLGPSDRAFDTRTFKWIAVAALLAAAVEGAAIGSFLVLLGIGVLVVGVTVVLSLVSKIHNGDYRFDRIFGATLAIFTLVSTYGEAWKLFAINLGSSDTAALINTVAQTIGVTLYLLIVARILFSRLSREGFRSRVTLPLSLLALVVFGMAQVGRKYNWIVVPVGYPLRDFNAADHPTHLLMKSLDRNIASITDSVKSSAEKDQDSEEEAIDETPQAPESPKDGGE